MYRVFLSALFTLIIGGAASQKVYFVYLQTEQEQPFFVKMNEKLYSSTGSGYLILSKLVDSTYSFNIGFPQNKWPAQSFTVPVKSRDHGYLLKNFGEKGWGLFDLQTLSVQMAAPYTSAETTVKTENKNVSAFTDILSKAADDPSLKEKSVQPKAEEKKPEIIIQEASKKEELKTEVKDSSVPKPAVNIDQPVVKKEEAKAETKDTTVAKPMEITGLPQIEVKEPLVTKPAGVIEQPVVKKEEAKVEIKEEPSVKTDQVKTTPVEAYKRSVITKKAESSTTDGFGLVFIDDNFNGVKDTIRLIIPNPKAIVSAAAAREAPKEEKKFLEIMTDTIKKMEEKIPDTKPVVADTVKGQEKTTAIKQVVSEPAITEKKLVRNNCPDVALDADFFKLRKEMAASENEDDMVTEARKHFKIKCFTVMQIKNLSALFLNDAGKYKFFDLSYLYVSDVENFTTLQSELKEEYYINRFKAMLRN